MPTRQLRLIGRFRRRDPVASQFLSTDGWWWGKTYSSHEACVVTEAVGADQTRRSLPISFSRAGDHSRIMPTVSGRLAMESVLMDYSTRGGCAYNW